jgi:hypothetical protein
MQCRVGWFLDEAEYFCGREYPTDLPIQIAERNIVMLRVVRGYAVSGHNNFMIPLVGVDCGHAHARVSVDTGDDDEIRSELQKLRVKVGSEERAVSLLYNHGIDGKAVELRKKFTALSPGDCDGHLFCAHLWKRIVEV